MADISQITVDNNTYDISDDTARESLQPILNTADPKATSGYVWTATSSGAEWQKAQGGYQWQLIDNITLAEDVGSYEKTLASNTYHEILIAVKGRIASSTTTSGSLSVTSLLQESLNSYRSVLQFTSFTMTNGASNYYAFGQLAAIKSLGVAGMLNANTDGFYGGTVSIQPGAKNSDAASEFLTGVWFSVQSVVLTAGTKIKLWGR